MNHSLVFSICVFSKKKKHAFINRNPDHKLPYVVNVYNIVVFNNMRTLKFKPQLTVYVFRCRQSSKRTSRETEAHFSRVKRSRLSVVIGRFRSILFVSAFQGSLAVAIIMIDGSKKTQSSVGL